MEKPTVAVDILGKSFNINCPKGHEAELKEAAEYLNNQMRELRASGKAVGLDAKLGRPNAVRELGLDGATHRLKTLLESGLESVPHCAGRDNLLRLVRAQSERFVPEKMGRTAA